MNRQTETLRRLAYAYGEIAYEERCAENLKLHEAVNDRRMIRPVVLIDELPWHEMDFDGSLTPVCEDPLLREVEIMMRRTLYRRRHFPADMTVQRFIPVRKVISDSGIGIGVEENTRVLDRRNPIISHEYRDQLADPSSLERLHPRVIAYDHGETVRRFARVGEAIGDIIPVRICGVEYVATPIWDNIARYRGVTPLLIDLAERPEYTHAMLKLLFSFEEDRLRQYEELGLLDPLPHTLHCTCAATKDLPRSGYDGVRATRKDIWGRGMAQIFAGVSPEMHEEFDIDYMMNTIGTCGLSYYGCCEPLDGKIGIVSKIPNLRKIGVTPWADTRAACEVIAGRYVVAAKPNPAAVAVPRVHCDQVRTEIAAIVKACADYGCSCDIVLKDISTCAGRPENIFAWERAAMEVVKNA